MIKTSLHRRRIWVGFLLCAVVVGGWSGCSSASPQASQDSTSGADNGARDTAAHDISGLSDHTQTPRIDSSTSSDVGASEINDGAEIHEVKPSGFGLDFDSDGIDDLSDNCIFDPNPTQDDTDNDGQGDLCDEDLDGDSVPNLSDAWPNDPALPGLSSPSLIYAHSAQSLYTLNPLDFTVTLLGDFVWPSNASVSDPLMADVAIDEFGVLYGVSFEDIFICHPSTLACSWLGAVPKRFNGLTFIPKEIMNTANDVLVATTPDGGWHKLSINEDAVSAETLGNYGIQYASNGDAFSVQGMGTFVTARENGVAHDFLGKVNPLTGTILESLVELVGYENISGLAGWNDKVFVFDGGGTILQVMLSNGFIQIVAETEIPWWGAGVRTSL